MDSLDRTGQEHLIEIELPAQYDAHPTVGTLASYLSDVSSLLDSRLARALVDRHPNACAADISGTSPSGIEPLWDWASSVGGGLEAEELADAREATLDCLCRSELDENAPEVLVTFVRSLQMLALPRQPAEDDIPTSLADLQAQRRHHQDIKQKPKKIHEVARMSIEAGKLVRGTDVRRVVDVGAGQGYLSRALSLSPYDLHVLALDGASTQTEGAQHILSSVETLAPPSSDKQGSIVHQTAHIASPSSLVASITSWVAEGASASPEPILLAGLHACGSLTLSILRTFIATMAHPDPYATWRPTSLLLVGCCYNLLTHSFPLYDLPSSAAPAQLTSDDPSTTRLTPLATSIIPSDLITQDHLQLAAQDPSSWQRIHNSAWRVGVRKIAWRALAERELATRGAVGPQRGWRVGKVGGGAKVWAGGEAGWKEYARVVGGRVGVEGLGDGTAMGEGDRSKLEFQLSVVHVFRCLLGPVIETLLLLDRYILLLTALPPTSPPLVISLKPIFDPSTGSLRNMALIVTPSTSSTA